MIKFQIIIDKKGFKKKVKTSKSFLNRISSSLALVLSILILSTIIGLGIHLVLAEIYTNPEYDPPLGNVDMPINVSEESQTKEGELILDATRQLNGTWRLFNSGTAYVTALWATGLMAGDKKILPGAISADFIEIFDGLKVDGKIHAPNQNWEHQEKATMTETSNTVYISCTDGWFLRKVQISDNPKNSQGWCAAPFEKYTVDTGGGGGGGSAGSDEEDEGEADETGYNPDEVPDDWLGDEGWDYDSPIWWPDGGEENDEIDYLDPVWEEGQFDYYTGGMTDVDYKVDVINWPWEGDWWIGQDPGEESDQ